MAVRRKPRPHLLQGCHGMAAAPLSTTGHLGRKMPNWGGANVEPETSEKVQRLLWIRRVTLVTSFLSWPKGEKRTSIS